MKKLIVIALAFTLVACDDSVRPGDCYQHKLTQSNKGLVIKTRRGDSQFSDNPIIVGKEAYGKTCITYEKDYAGNNILSNCLEYVNLGPYTKEYYLSEVRRISCDGIVPAVETK